MKSLSSKVERNNANRKTCCKSKDDQSSKFYNIIPHDFGKIRSKSIDNPEALQQKYDMLAVLDNVELASSIRHDKDTNANQKTCCKSRDDQSSKFYNIIPHDFGKTRSKSIDNPEALQQKYDMLAVLDNVELASSIRPDKDNNANRKTCCKSKDDQSSKFYNIIPHDFGKTRSKSIDNPEALQQKYDMLAILDNVELASSIRHDKDK
ncbi:unnamed protein product [Rotaria sp. Silwood1]|nr:unnamed protein product [Rotaria sp. Silwood1]